MMKTLKDAKPGETVTLVKYHDTGDIDLRRHLLGMGFVKGAEIHVKKVATLGDPIEMSIKGYDICLRKEEAKNIYIILIINFSIPKNYYSNLVIK